MAIVPEKPTQYDVDDSCWHHFAYASDVGRISHCAYIASRDSNVAISDLNDL